MNRRIDVVADSYPAVPGLDTTLARAVLRAVSAGELGETFRIYSPGRVLAFGKRDAIEPGFAEAAAAARQSGYTPLIRLAGGRAAVFHGNTLAFGWCLPIADPRQGIQARFEMLAQLLVGAFARVGVASAVGEIPGEYCPGRFSVHHTGGKKIMGVGQRLARKAAHLGGVIVIKDPGAINEVLEPVYGALGVDFDPAATGSLADVNPEVTATGLFGAIVAELRDVGRVVPGVLSTRLVDAGHAMLEDHLVQSTE